MGQIHNKNYTMERCGKSWDRACMIENNQAAACIGFGQARLLLVVDHHK
jgi:hypothetical protein